MHRAGMSYGRGSLIVFAVGLCLLAAAPPAAAQFFDGPRPPGEVPTPPPAVNLAPPNPTARDRVPPPSGPVLQSLPPAPAALPPSIPAGQAGLALSARFGHDMPGITGGLVWRIYGSKPDQTGAFRLLKEDRAPAPTLNLPPGGYVIHVGFGLASATRAVQLRAGETTREVFEIPAGGLRIEGRVGDARIPPGQISFDVYKGSQFEPSDKRPIAQSVMTGDMVLMPEGIYHIVSNYGDANSVVRSDIRVQAGKLTDATVTHRAAIITLKLVNEKGGEAIADTQWSVLSPSGDVIKESIGAFPRVILAEGDYRVIARNDNRSFEREFKVITGVDGEVEVLTR
ncbi:MAG TPA: hypothetical protein VKW08_07595 [Xanthobacteraceae bacterium]|nr:hypothetical protein [Xanthobacteraceae bacterium]